MEEHHRMGIKKAFYFKKKKQKEPDKKIKPKGSGTCELEPGEVAFLSASLTKNS